MHGFRGFIGLLLLLSLGSCSKSKLTPQQAGELFFSHVSAGKFQEAYEETAFAFQAQQSQSAFETNIKEMGLLGCNARLSVLEQEEKTARLDVEILRQDNETLHQVLTMQIDAGAWRVFSLKSPRSLETGRSENRFTIVGKPAAFNDAANQRMPDGTTLTRLVNEAMANFATALQEKSFTAFYAYTANAWQSQLSEKQLEKAFQVFMDRGVNLVGVMQSSPVFDTTPLIGTDGLLLVSGSYPTKPYQVVFSLKFIYELPSWKLFGLDVYLRKAPDAESSDKFEAK